MPANVDTMAYRGETPWHGLGAEIPANEHDPATIQRLAGLTWEPVLKELSYDHDGETRLARARAMVRSDSGDVLDVVGPDYVPIRNEEVVAFFRDYCDAGAATLETVGALDGGRRVWALAKLNAGFKLPGNDRVESYMLLANPHIYGKGAVAKLTCVRVVCHNTWQAALRGAGESVKIWHTAEFNGDRRTEVQEQLTAARAQLREVTEVAKLLAQTRVDQPVRGRRGETTAHLLLRSIYRVDDEGTQPFDELPVTVQRTFALYAGEGRGAELVSARGTAWGLFNAVTQRVDWEGGRTADTRLRGAWFGRGQQLKRRALKVLADHAAN